MSSVALLAAAIGFYALLRLGESLDEISLRKVPAALAALNLAQASERIVAAGPSLSSIIEPTEILSVVVATNSDVARAGEGLDELRRSGLDRTAVERIADRLAGLAANINAIDLAARRRFEATRLKLALLRAASMAYLQLGEAWAPRFEELQEHLADLQRSVAPAGRLRLDETMQTIRSLTEIQRASAEVFELMVRSANATLESDVTRREARVVSQMGRLDALVAGLDGKLAASLGSTIRGLHLSATASNNLFAARRDELAALHDERKLIAENAGLSSSLTGAIAELVATSRSEMTAAAGDAARLRRIGQNVLAAAVVVIVVSSILIVWLYVGRNIAGRLSRLSAAMAAIAGGRRDVVVATSGRDEITAMGRAVEVFRHNAINLDRLLAEQQDQSARLEAVVRERTAELNEALERAETMSRTKSTFLANMSHELRTPLNAVIGYSEMLQEEANQQGDEDPIEDLQKIEGAGHHLLGLISDILDLSKIEAGKMEILIEDVDLGSVVGEVVSIIKPLADKNGNTLEVVCPADLGRMRSDRPKVKQALLNLLSNAAKFTTKGRLTLALSRKPGSKVSFRVSDTGPGMTLDQLGKLFQPFSQGDD